jgi:hypothetical protein
MGFFYDLGFYGVLAVFVLVLLASAIRILREYERTPTIGPSPASTPPRGPIWAGSTIAAGSIWGWR